MTDFPETYQDFYSVPRDTGWDWLRGYRKLQIHSIITFTGNELDKIRQSYDLATLLLQYSSRLFKVTLLDSRQFTVTIPITYQASFTYQLLKFAISKETGLDSVTLAIYSSTEKIGDQTDFSNIDNQLECLVTENMTLRCQLKRDDIIIYYGKKHPNQEFDLPTRYIKLKRLSNGCFGGNLPVIGLEDGYFKVDLRELDNWQADTSHLNYYEESGWINWIDGIRIQN